MATAAIYVITSVVACFLAAVIYRSEDAPGPAYVVLGLVVAFLLLFLLIDARGIDDIPGFRIGHREYAFVRRTEQQVTTGLLKLESRIAALESAKTSSATPTATRFPKILWVDDNPSDNTALVSFLTDRNVSVAEVLSTQQAIDKLQAHTFDAVISDMGRKESNIGRNTRAGLDLLQAVRRTDRQIPVFFYSSRTDLAPQAIESGAKLFTSSSSKLLAALGFGADAP